MWLDILGGNFGSMGLWADFEDNYKGLWSGWRHWYTFMEEVKRLAPSAKLGVYTAYYYWVQNTISVGIPAASLEYFKQYPLWVANYNVTRPLIPKPWTDWLLWQYTEKGDGKPYGVASANIDLNHYKGDFVQPPPPPPEPTEGRTIHAKFGKQTIEYKEKIK